MLLTFGIEIEVLLKPQKDSVISSLRDHGWSRSVDSGEFGPRKDKRAKNRKALFSLVAQQLRDNGVLAEASAVHEHIPGQTYTKWLVKDEKTINEEPGYCELIPRNCMRKHLH
jgi:hypothetical protein